MNTIVLVTGCSDGGIGSAIAKTYAMSNCRVFATARKLASMSELVSDPRITLLRLDVCDHESIQRCQAEVSRATEGRLDILVNNAGIAYSSAAIELDLHKCRDVFDTNLFGIMDMNIVFGPMLLKSKGTICCTGSIAGLVAVPFGGIYNTSKAALAMYTDCLRLELEPFGVKVINFVTGQVQSNIVSNSADRYSMSPASLYKSIERDITRVRISSQGRHTLSRHKYAEAVVKASLRSRPPPRLYKGTLASLVWILSTFCPFTLIEFITSRRSGLHKLRRLSTE